MNLLKSPKSRFIICFTALSMIACGPVWAVEYFVNQDGSGHVYAARLMLDLLKGNPLIGEVYALNSVSVPNSTGHWLMVLLLPVFSPVTVTKLMVSLTLVGYAAAAAWVRRQTAGEDGLLTAALLGFVLGFNWLWLIGSYNFMIGAICFAFALGLFFQWREAMTPRRCLGLGILLVMAFLSHLISFLVLAGSLCALAVLTSAPARKKALIYTGIAFAPVLPLIFLYKNLSQGGEPFDPAWRSLADPFSLKSWLVQFSTADPFVLLSRKTFPFTVASSKFFAVFSPVLWVAAALAALALATYSSARFKEIFSAKYLPLTLLFVFSMLAALFAPDDFGLTNGSILRERLILCGLIFFVPLFRFGENSLWKRAGQAALLFVILFQTAVLWEYALHSNREAREYLAAGSVIERGDTIASVSVVAESLRFHTVAIPQMGNYLGFKENLIVWDNYEIGHYLFPVVARSPADKRFAFELTTSNAFYEDRPELSERVMVNLEKVLAADHQKIRKLIVWGRTDPRLDEVLSRWFDPQPIYQSANLRVLKHK